MTSPGFDDWPDLEATRTSLDALAGRVEADPDKVEKGLAQLVLSLVELLRQLMERQAIRRVEAGGLSDDQVERLGTTLMLLERRMGELREIFGLTEEELSLDLGPLGRTV
ncbi:MAG TPA: gas vesicle protein K [Actinomycetes bacterium]